MVAAKPKAKIEDVFERVLTLAQDRTGTSFTHRRIIREIEDLLKIPGVDIGHCHYGLALLYFLEGDRTRSFELFRSALSYSPDQVAIHVAYINSLSESGSFSQAFSLLPALMQKFPGQRSAYECAIIVSYHSLQFSKVRDYLQSFHQLVVNDAAERFLYYEESLMLTLSQIEHYAVSEPALLSLLETAVTHLRSEKIEVRATSQVILRDGRLVYSLLIDDDYEGCAEKSFSVAMALCEKHENTYMEFVSIICKPLSNYQPEPL